MRTPDVSRLRICWGTPIVEVENPDHSSIKASLVRHCYDRCRRDERRVGNSVGALADVGLGGDAFDLFRDKDAAIQSLKAFCSDALLAMLIQLDQQFEARACGSLNPRIDLHESWVRITKDGGFHEPHTHQNCSWCGIYFVDVGDSSIDPPNGANQFFPPFVHTYQDLGTKIWPLETVTVRPREGTLVLFPSYIRHSAAPYRGLNDRVIIAFNARVRSS